MIARPEGKILSRRSHIDAGQCGQEGRSPAHGVCGWACRSAWKFFAIAADGVLLRSELVAMRVLYKKLLGSADGIECTILISSIIVSFNDWPLFWLMTGSEPEVLASSDVPFRRNSKLNRPKSWYYMIPYNIFLWMLREFYRLRLPIRTARRSRRDLASAWCMLNEKNQE